MSRTFISPKYISAGNTYSIPSGELWEVAIYTDRQEFDLHVGSDEYRVNATGQQGNTNYDSNRHYYLTSNGNTSLGNENDPTSITGWKRNLSNFSKVLEKYPAGGTTQVPTGEVWHVAIYSDSRTNILDGSGNQYGIICPVGYTGNEYTSGALYTFGEGTQLESRNDPAVAMGWSETI